MFKTRFLLRQLFPLLLACSTFAHAAKEMEILYHPSPDSPIGSMNKNAPEGLKQFGFLIGDWDAEITWTAANSDPISYMAKWHNHWIIDGFAVMQEWRGPHYTGTEIRNYIPSSNSWTGRNLYVGSDWKKTVAHWQDNNMIVTILDAEDKNGHFLNRETYYDIQPDSFEMKSERSYDDGKTWQQGRYFMHVKRTKQAAQNTMGNTVF